ncbi:Poly(A) polymerase catalytic subunit (3), partial [Monkeypox virus]
VRYTHG